MAESAWLADLQRTVYPRCGHPSAAGRAQDGKFAGQKTDVLPTVPHNQPQRVTNKCDCLCFSDRLIADEDVCDKDCVSEARVVGLMFAVGRLLDSIKQTMQSAAKPDRSNLSSRLLYISSLHL